jgi:hypothetical protein
MIAAVLGAALVLVEPPPEATPLEAPAPAEIAPLAQTAPAPEPSPPPAAPAPPPAVPNLTAAPPPPEPSPPAPSAPTPPRRPSGQIGGDDVAPDDSAWPHYDQGVVLLPTTDPVKQPFRLKLNHVSQFKYTNSLATNATYTDHNGMVHDVQQRNDIQLTRDVFYFSGFAFDRRLDFNVLVFTSTATLVATAAGYAGYVFSRGFALRAGYFSLPSTRAMTGTYPWFHGTDRSLSTNYFRPGFTQGVWANGEPLPGWNYIAMVGNSLNTLDIKSTNIDNKLSGAVSIWYDHNDFNQFWNDYEHHDAVALRLGNAFTFSREDRLSDLSQAGPENNATFISDGLFLFETGSLAPNVTISLANFYLWAIDGGVKYKGFALNVEFYLRWLNRFAADGPLPINSMFDWGFDSSVGYFVARPLELFGRSSLIQGPFATAVEGSLGFTWYPFPTRGVWINAEVAYVRKSPYAGGYYMYSVGQTGIVVPAQFMLRF